MKMFKLIFLAISVFFMTTFSALSYAETSTAYVKSSAITADVKAKFLADSDIKSTHISVTTKNGIVTLRGYVASADVKEKAVSIAGQVDGVKSVKDKLVIKHIK